MNSISAPHAESPPSPAPHPALRDEPVRHIGVFRALVLGDLLCAVPAWRAIKAAWPEATLTLIGLPWARELVERLPLIDRFIEFPGFPGLPEMPPRLDALPDFLRQMQAERFDLLLQMHGSGNLVNPLLASFGPRRLAGFHEPPSRGGRHVFEDELFTPWPAEGHEIERMLALTDHLGLPRQGLQLEFPVTDDDRRALDALCPALRRDAAAEARPIACVHAGAQLPSRRWMPERFAAVADWLVEQGCEVVLTGARGEAALVGQVAAAMRHEALNLAGRTSLWTLGALLERARLLVCNDTGVSHVAAALRTPSVVISSGADVARWAPLDAARHRVLAQPLPCRPCAHPVCPYDHDCARAISAGQVIDEARRQLAAPGREPGVARASQAIAA